MGYFVFEDFRYSYVMFEDDGQRDAPVLELAKEVLRSHSNRYTLSVLRRKMEEPESIYGRHYAGAVAGGQTGQQGGILPV